MAATATEQVLINKLQSHFGALNDITTAYTFASNPDTLARAALPATIFYPFRSSVGLGAHHNVWRYGTSIRAIVFVTEREAAGGRLKFLENKAITLMQAIRTKFTTESVVLDFLSAGLSSAYTFELTYDLGGRNLTWNGVEYIGIIVDFEFTEIG